MLSLSVVTLLALQLTLTVRHASGRFLKTSRPSPWPSSSFLQPPSAHGGGRHSRTQPRTRLQQKPPTDQRLETTKKVAQAAVRIPISHMLRSWVLPLAIPPIKTARPTVDDSARLAELKKFDGVFSRDDWAAAFKSQPEEFEYVIDEVEGSIPKDINGTYLRLGPALFERANQTTAHWMDGDGYLTAISFRDGKAWLRSRYVVTPDFLDEQNANQFLYRGCFGTYRNPDSPHARCKRATQIIRTLERLRQGDVPSPLERMTENAMDARLKAPPNTNIALFPRREGPPMLLALHEAGLPWALEINDLSTVGPADMDLGGDVGVAGAAESASSSSSGSSSAGRSSRSTWHWLDGIMEMEGDASNAHPKVEADRGNFVAFTWQVGAPMMGKPMGLTIREWADDGTLLSVMPYEMPDAVAAPHDWGITESYYILPDPPMQLQPLPFLLGQKGPVECLKKLAGPLRLHLVPRPTGPKAGTPPRVVDVGEVGFPIHLSGFEDDEGRVVIYSEAWGPEFLAINRNAESLFGANEGYWPDPTSSPQITLYRTVIDVSSEEHPRVVEHRPTPGFERLSIAQPISHPKLDVVSKKVDAWYTGRRAFSSQPTIAHRPLPRAHRHPHAHQDLDEETSGWMMGIVHDMERGRPYLAIFHPKYIHKGPVAKLWLKHHIPWGIHTHFAANLHMDKIQT
ncbi:unnamed protein product [Vitrella brassicaformis CCMP3155]|uniref:Carotenoid oxygenase n=1 Tax=Vitrella brassicaformis (strain CCMP3155) TaxID=1169540 RepID=A0A0G4EYD5_VITBC|nr:unnamed protein product [Vitrella brassicaformis CCMP3155]|eukprot:CEM03644.1 unnamed protein product [Vitrella brassicaformis CCMP3155]